MGKNDRLYVWRSFNTAFEENSVVIVKQGGGSIINWGCFVAAVILKVGLIDSTMDAARGKIILNKCVLALVGKFGL